MGKTAAKRSALGSPQPSLRICQARDTPMMIESGSSFKGHSIVSCGTMRFELDFLRENGFLERIYWLTVGWLML